MKKVCVMAALIAAPMFLGGCFKNDDVQPGLEQRFIQETQLIDEYLQDNGLTAEIDSYSLLRYEELLEGNGLAPYTANSVNMTYTITLLATGEEVEAGTEVTFLWTDMILGLQLGLRNVRESGRMILYVPSVLAYGESGNGDIPPNAILIYDITLNSFDNPQLRNDVSYIQTYLNDNGITATRHPSGIYYKVNEPGTGLTPTWGSNILVDYEGRLIETQEVFDSGTGSMFNLSSLIIGWQIGLQYVSEGGNITLYIPSTFGYGADGAGSTIPPNANLEFDISLNSVMN